MSTPRCVVVAVLCAVSTGCSGGTPVTGTFSCTVELGEQAFRQFGMIVKPAFENGRKQEFTLHRISAEHIKHANNPTVPAPADAAPELLAVVVAGGDGERISKMMLGFVRLGSDSSVRAGWTYCFALMRTRMVPMARHSCEPISIAACRILACAMGRSRRHGTYAANRL